MNFLRTISMPAVFFSAKCLLLWHHLLGKIVIIRIFAWTNLFNFIRITRQILITSYSIRRVVPRHRDRTVTTDYCDVISPHVYTKEWDGIVEIVPSTHPTQLPPFPPHSPQLFVLVPMLTEDIVLVILLKPLLWSPYVIGQTIIFMPCDFYLLSSFFLA